MTTERLLEAAESLLRERGVDAATLRAIADRAGVSVGIVYRQFQTKTRCFEPSTRASLQESRPQRTSNDRSEKLQPCRYSRQ